jgi:hypothetical protein
MLDSQGGEVKRENNLMRNLIIKHESHVNTCNVFNFGPHLETSMLDDDTLLCVGVYVRAHTQAPPPHVVMFAWDISSRDNIFSCCQHSSQKQHATQWSRCIIICNNFALPTNGRIFIVFRFIIEYSSSRDFGSLGNNNNRSIFIWGILKDDLLACVETWD